MRRTPLVLALLLMALGLALPGRALVEALRPGMGADPALRGGVLLLKALIGFHGVLLLSLEALRSRLLPAPRLALLTRGLREPGRVGAGEAVALCALLLLGAALRFHALDEGLWIGEVDALVRHLRRPLPELLTTFDHPDRHPLYALLARSAAAAFGEHAWSLRLPAALFGVASLYAAWRLARLVAPRREVLFAVALLALSSQHVWLSQDAQGYTGLLLFSTLGSEAFLRLLASHDPRRTATAWTYGGAMALATWTHPGAVFVVVTHALVWAVLAWRSRGRPGVARWIPCLGLLLAASLTLLLYAPVLDPLIATTAQALREGVAGEWRSPGWLARRTLGGLTRVAPGGPSAALAFLVLACAVGALGLSSYARQGWAVLGVLLGGVLVTLLALALLRQHLWPRHLFVGAVGLALVVGRGLVGWVRLFARAPPLSTWSATLERAVLVLTCLVSAASVPAAWGPKQDFAAAVAFLEARAKPEDALLTAGGARVALGELFARAWPAVESVEELEAIEAVHPRTWIVLCGPVRLHSTHAALWDHIERGYDAAAVFQGTASEGEVLVMVRRR
jgi:4-amino-4-deoxy-L-arabinose transferase-like glycosyltransferase